MVRSFCLGIVTATSIFAAAPGHSCDIALAFAVDVSASISRAMYQSQLDGLAEALRDPTITSELHRADAALTLVQWTGARFQEISLPWTQMQSAADVAAFAASVQMVPRAWRGANTAIGEMLGFTSRVFADAPTCHRQVLDVSGNGKSNEGVPPETRRGGLVASGVTINAIVVETDTEGLASYYADNVIGGLGAFVIRAEDITDYAEKMRQKLFRELVIQMAATEPPGPFPPPH